MISIRTPNWQQRASDIDEGLPIPPDEYRTMARADGDVIAEGLGTLVAHGDETLLVTHDHWSLFDEALGTVTFRNADGSLIAETDLRAFKQLLQYRDGGTMVLNVPEVLASAVPGRAFRQQIDDLHSGDSVLLTQRSNGRVVLTKANVVAQKVKQGRPVVRLQSADGESVAGGDSGGGVWVEGRLAATMWTTITMKNIANNEQRSTDLSEAAIYEPQGWDAS